MYVICVFACSFTCMNVCLFVCMYIYTVCMRKNLVRWFKKCWSGTRWECLTVCRSTGRLHCRTCEKFQIIITKTLPRNIHTLDTYLPTYIHTYRYKHLCIQYNNTSIIHTCVHSYITYKKSNAYACLYKFRQSGNLLVVKGYQAAWNWGLQLVVLF